MWTGALDETKARYINASTQLISLCQGIFQTPYWSVLGIRTRYLPELGLATAFVSLEKNHEQQMASMHDWARHGSQPSVLGHRKGWLGSRARTQGPCCRRVGFLELCPRGAESSITSSVGNGRCKMPLSLLPCRASSVLRTPGPEDDDAPAESTGTVVTVLLDRWDPAGVRFGSPSCFSNLPSLSLRASLCPCLSDSALSYISLSSPSPFASVCGAGALCWLRTFVSSGL